MKRATTSGGTYTNIANVAGTNYTDAGVIGGATVIGGTTYYYVVSAVNVGGESANSAQASVTPTVNVPSPWLTRDIGAVGLAGWASFTNGIFTVIGSGADIGSTADAFRFVHVTNSGDCTIIARVTSASVEDINPWSKAGVMIRESFATERGQCLDRRDAGQRGDFSIPFQRRRRHNLEQHDRLERALLGQAGAQRKYVHRILFVGRCELDTGWKRDVHHGLHGVCRFGGHQP